MDTKPGLFESPVTQEHVVGTPSTNRFLFVDIAALRAKQLRRGALPRLAEAPAESEASLDTHREAPFKPERVAMEEVRRGLVQYHLPPVVGTPAAAR